MRGRGSVCSLVLHLGLWAALLEWGNAAPPPIEDPPRILVVDLVRGPGGDSGGAAASSPGPTPPPQAATAPAAARSTAPTPRHFAQPARPPSRPIRPEDSFDARLRAEARRLGGGGGSAQDGAAGGDGHAGGGASVKDMVRAQVFRHWTFDMAALSRVRRVITMHVVLAADGGVDQVEIVSPPQSKAEQELARSARNAVLLAAPITLPAGLPESARDLMLDFDPAQVTR